MANQKLNAIITIGAAMNASVRKTLGGVSGALNRVGDEIATITKRQRELDKQRKILERQGQSVEELDREYQDLGRTLDNLRAKQERLQGISDGIGNVGQTATDAFGTVATQATIAAAAIGAVGTAAFGVANSTAQAARDVDLFAKISNASTTEFQRMAAAAQSVGIEQDKMADILKDVNDRVGDFLTTGGGPMADFFENIAPKVGVTAEQFAALSGPEALQLFVTSLEKAGASQQEMTFYMEAMASDATALIPLLRDNGAEMNRLADSAAAVGQILDDQTIAAAREYTAQMNRARRAMMGVRNTIGAALIPIVGDLAAQFTAFVTENRPQIEAFARSMGQAFSDALPVIGQVVSGISDVAGTVGTVIAAVADLLGGWDNLGIAVGTAFVAPSILAIGKLGASLLGLIAATGPIGMVIAGVAAAAGLIIANWDTIKAGAIVAWDAIKTAAGTAFDWISQKVAWLAEAGFLGPIGLIVAHWDSVRVGAETAFNALSAAGEAAVNWVVSKFEYLAQAVNGILAPIREALSWVGSTIDSVGNWWNGGEGPERGSLPPGSYTNPVDEFGSYAKGGPMQPGAALVGEQGPELIFPSRQGYVATARQTRDLLSGGGGRQINVGGITINAGAGADPNAIAEAVMRRLAAEERRAMYDGGHA